MRTYIQTPGNQFEHRIVMTLCSLYRDSAGDYRLPFVLLIAGTTFLLGSACVFAQATGGQASVAIPAASSETLTADDYRALRTALSYVHVDYYEVAMQFDDRPIVPVLIQIIEDDREHLQIRQDAVFVLGATRDPRGLPVLKEIIDRPLEGRLTHEQWTFLHAAILNLGLVGDDKTLSCSLKSPVSPTGRRSWLSSRALTDGEVFQTICV